MSAPPFERLATLDALARAHATTHPLPGASPIASHAMAVRAGGMALRVSMRELREVVRCPSLARVPGARRWLRGLATVAGEAVVVLDLGALVSGQLTRQTSGAPLLLRGQPGQLLALLVDEVGGPAPVAGSMPAPAGECPWLSLEDPDGLRWLDVGALLASSMVADSAEVGRAPRPVHAGAGPW